MRARVSLAILLGVAACKKEDRASDDGSSKPVPTVETPADGAAQTEASGVRDDGTIVSAVDWFDGTLEDALAHARSENKLVLADVGAYWCPPCHRYDEEVFTVPEIGTYLAERYVAIHIDAEKGEGPELVDRYKVQAYPTLLVLEPSGVEKGRIVDFLEAQELKVSLDRIAAGHNVLADLEAAVQIDPDDLDKRYGLGHAYALAARRPEAERHFEVVMLGDPKGEMGLAPKVMYDRAMFFTHKLDSDLQAAIDEYRTLQRRFPDSESALRAYRQIGRLQHLLGQSDEAIASLDAMLAQDPDDPGLAASYGWFSFREKCQPAAGLRVVEAAIEAHPEDAQLHYLRAELSHLVGNDVAALEAMRKASALEPKSAYYKRQVRRFTDLAEKTG